MVAKQEDIFDREAYMNKDKKVVNEFDNPSPSMSDFKKEFKDNYNMDATKEFYVEELEDIRDIQYHGKHKGYKMFTYFDDERNELRGRCPVLGISIGENFIGKKGIDPMVKEIKDVIDWFTSGIREGESKGVYYSPFLKKNIRV